MRRELVVLLAAVVGAVAGFHVFGGTGTPAEVFDTLAHGTVETEPIIGAILFGLGVPWLVNKLVFERPTGTRGKGTRGG